jgi:hypothetical protein
VMYRRNGNDMASRGLYVELAPWASHLFRFVRAGK